jgi:hypothetical protein
VQLTLEQQKFVEKILHRIEALRPFVRIFRLFFSLTFFLLHARQNEEDFVEFFV